MTGRTEDKERKPLTTYALDKSSHKSKCNKHTRDKSSMDSNKLRITRNFMNSQTTGNCAVSPGEWNPTPLFFFSPLQRSFCFYYVLTCFSLLLYVQSVSFVMHYYTYSSQPELWASSRMFLLRWTDDEVRHSSDATLIFCTKCTKLHLSEHKGSQTRLHLPWGLRALFHPILSSQRYTSLSFIPWGLILHLSPR